MTENKARSLRWDAEDVARMCDKFKRTDADRWVACCPAHKDKTPSLAIRNGNNGGVLLYCFAGCEIQAITAALGIQVSDLMPERAPTDYKPQRKLGVHPMDALLILQTEAAIVLLAAFQLANGEPMHADDLARLKIAHSRIQAAKDLAVV